LNIWSTTCGICLAEFPLLDSLYDTASANDQVEVYSAWILQNQSANEVLNYVRNRGLRFPVLTISDWKVVEKEYGVNGVPLTCVVRRREILYRGSLIDSWKFIELQLM
jgi:hypothetical protein